MRTTTQHRVCFLCIILFALSCIGCTEKGESDEAKDGDTSDPTKITLDDGTVLALPTYFKANRGVMILGTADKNALRSMQRTLDAYTPVEQSGRGICFIWFFDYSADSDLGSYTEIAFTHMATRSDLPLELDFDITDFGSLASNFMTLLEKTQIVNAALWLNSDLGIAAGEQIWGYPKLKAQFNDSSEEGEDGQLRHAVEVVETQSGRTVMSLSMVIPSSMIPGISVPPLEGLTTGTWDNKNGPHRLFSRMENLESIAMRAWDENQDKLALGSGTQQLDMLQALNFQPVGSFFYGSFDLFIESPMKI